jgi:hypothetical protein
MMPSIVVPESELSRKELLELLDELIVEYALLALRDPEHAGPNDKVAKHLFYLSMIKNSVKSAQ